MSFAEPLVLLWMYIWFYYLTESLIYGQIPTFMFWLNMSWFMIMLCKSFWTQKQGSAILLLKDNLGDYNWLMDWVVNE